MATAATPGAFWRGLRLLPVDGTGWDVADSEANEAAFGRPGSGRTSGRSAFPQVRMAALVEIGSHAVLYAELAGCRAGEVTLMSRLPRSAGPGQLVLADRGSSASRCGRRSPPPAPTCCGGCPLTAGIAMLAFQQIEDDLTAAELAESLREFHSETDPQDGVLGKLTRLLTRCAQGWNTASSSVADDHDQDDDPEGRADLEAQAMEAIHA